MTVSLPSSTRSVLLSGFELVGVIRVNVGDGTEDPEHVEEQPPHRVLSTINDRGGETEQSVSEVPRDKGKLIASSTAAAMVLFPGINGYGCTNGGKSRKLTKRSSTKPSAWISFRTCGELYGASEAELMLDRVVSCS